MHQKQHHARNVKAICLRLMVFLCFIVVFSSSSALSPDKQLHQFLTEVWDSDAGLPSVQFDSMATGPEGYLWLGTPQGLARFDGVRFRSFGEDTAPGLVGNVIGPLLLDREGHSLWIGTYKGLTVYRDRQFRSLTWTSTYQARSLAQRTDGSILVASEHGLLVASDSSVNVWPGVEEQVYSVTVRDEEVWAGMAGEVRRISDDQQQSFALPVAYSTAAVTVLKDYRGHLLAGTTRGLLKWVDGEWESVLLPESHHGKQISSLEVDRQGVLWISTGSRVIRLLGDQLLTDLSIEPSFSRVTTIEEDGGGNIWLADREMGVVRLRNGFSMRYSSPEGLHDDLVWSVAPESDDAKSVLVGTNDGISRFSDGRFEKLSSADTEGQLFVYTMLPEGERIWLGQARAGLAIFEQGEVRPAPGAERIAQTVVSSIIRASDNTLWLATSEGLCAYAQPELICHGLDEGFQVGALRVVRELKDKRLLVGSHKGLFEFDGQRFQRIAGDVIDENEDITSVDELTDGSLVVGSLSGRLFMGIQGQWSALDGEGGLPLNAAFFSHLDSQGFLWVAGFSGLYRAPMSEVGEYARRARKSIAWQLILGKGGAQYGADPVDCCNGAGSARGFSRDDVLWLPTSDGVVSVDTNDIDSILAPPRLVIEQARIDGQWVDQTTNDIVLPTDARDLGLRFTALSFGAAEQVRFRYRMLGYDVGWQSPADRDLRGAFYTQLPAGQFTFEVSASNQDGVWQNDIASVVVRVPPMVYETLWFWGLCAMATLMMLYLGSRFLLAEQRRKGEHLQMLVRERTHELEEANRELEQASNTDPLTGLWNRRFLGDFLEKEIPLLIRKFQSGRNNDWLTFAMVDLDHFKKLNDTYGHSAGDRVLKECATLIQSVLRTGDFVARWGGEEFVVVLRHERQAQGQLTLDRLMKALRSHRFDLQGSNSPETSVTCSIGYSVFPFFPRVPDALSWKETMEIADHAMYEAKSLGRNQCIGLLAGDDSPTAMPASKIIGETQALLDSRYLRRIDS